LDMNDAPLVFMSHASEDKERFVLGFARRLRQQGVNIWLDRWEMYPGDSLVDKIFNEGVKGAAAIIIVLSQHSVTKPWVKEELDSAIVRRVSSGCKLIPVVLDDCEIPEALKATVWEKIENLEDYGSSLSRVVGAIFGCRERPELGTPPPYTSLEIKGIAGLTKTDALVLREFARRVLERGDLLHLNTEEVREAISRLGISSAEFRDSCTILCACFFLEPAKMLAPEPPYYSLTEHGLDLYLQDREPEFWAQLAQAAYAILNEGVRDNDTLAALLGVDRRRARLILIIMGRRRLIELRTSFGGHARVKEVYPALRRTLQGR
jgi:hypothetical protein